MSKQQRIDWDGVHFELRRALERLADPLQSHSQKARIQAMPIADYRAAYLTHAVFAVVDFTFKDNHDWGAVFDVMRTQCREFEVTTQTRDIRSFASRATQLIAEIIDFEDYCSQYGVSVNPSVLGVAGDEC